MNTVTIKLQPPYAVHIGRALLAAAGARIAALDLDPTHVVIVTSPRVAHLWGRELEAGLRRAKMKVSVLRIPDGEEKKNLKTVETLLRGLARLGADRRSLLVALGGGVIGDVAGFAAASYMRGVNVVQVPTTLLAQVDAAIGGKTGVNLPEGKNLAGAFHQPSMVLADTRTLSTLSGRQFRAGLFEVIKCGVIADAALFRFCENAAERRRILARDPDALEAIVTAAVRVKAKIVAADEREAGLRRLLNFGHTIGHALEAESSYRCFLHGEAVAWGMIAAAEIGANAGVTPPETAERIVAAVLSYGPLPPVKASPAALVRLLQRDKKTVRGVPHFVLARSLGKAEVVSGISSRIFIDAIAGLRGW